MSVQIVVDSTADLAAGIRHRVTAVPLTVCFGEEEYIDGVTITGSEFYEKLATAKALPTTSQASPFAFSAVFGQAVAAGHEVVAIAASSELSGTYRSALLGAEDYPGKVFVVDSQNIAIGSAILAQYALMLADAGHSGRDIARMVEGARSRVRLMAVVDTLEYLHRGGRLSRTAAIAGGLLAVKPIISVVDGQIKVLSKGRGNKQANQIMNQLVQKAGVDETMPCMLGYTGTDPELLNRYRSECGGLWPAQIPVELVCSVVGTHAGPGAVAVAFFEKKN